MNHWERPDKPKRSKTWTKVQRKEFGKRLRWAQDKAGFRFAADVIARLEEVFDISKPQRSTYYSHLAGERVPDDDETIARYAELFQVSYEFLTLQTGWPGYVSDDKQLINQAIEDVESNLTPRENVRYLSILTASDIRLLLLGKGTAMTAERVPVPQHVAAGPRSFCYPIPEGDQSMVGVDGGGYGPGYIITVDQDRAIEPGAFLLAWPAGFDAPVFRRLKAAHPVSAAAPRAPYELVALNPYAASIKVERAEDCQIIGRAIAFTGLI